MSVNAVTLSAAGAATNYLDETGAYSVPPAGGGGAAGTINYDYNTTIGGDPGAGNFRMSTGNPANIAALYFSDTDADALDIQNILGTLAVGCHIIMRNTADNTQFRVYVVSAITDNAGWYQFNVDEAEGSGATSIVNGTEIEFEFFTSGWVQPGVDIGIANQKEIAFWNPGPDYWEGSGSLISINQNSPPLGGRLRLGTTSGYSTTGPQIMRPLGAADTVMDFVYASDPNNGFLQGYWRVAGEMHFGARIASVNTELLVFDLSANVRIEAAANFRIEEKGAAAADLTAYGQLWVNSADDSLNYQTEAGVNFDLTASAGSPFATPLIVLGDINTATPPTTEAVTGNLEIWDLSETDKLASFGFNADDQLEMINDMEGSAADTNTLHFGFGRSTNSSVEGMTLSSEASLILTSNSTATGGNAPNDDQIISMVNRTRTQTFLELGVYGATDSLQLKNMMTGQPTVLEGRYASLVANVAPMLIANPHGNIAEPYDSQIGGVIQYYGEQFVTAFPASRTMPVASGVFQLNTDGAGTWERVLTTSDLSGLQATMAIGSTSSIDLSLITGAALIITDAADVDTVTVEINTTTMAPAESLAFIATTNIEVYSFDEPINIDGGSLHVNATNGGLEFWRYGDSVGSSLKASAAGVTLQIVGSGDTFRVQSDSIELSEASAPVAFSAGWGQIWIDDEAPCRLMFTNDDGDDYTVAIAGGTQGDNVFQNASHNFNTAGNKAANFIGYFVDGGADTVTLENSTSVVNWPVWTVIQLIAPGSNLVTITEGTGITLSDDQGNDVGPSVVLQQGVVSIIRASTTSYIIWGSGWA